MTRDAPPDEADHTAILDRLSDGVVALDERLRYTYLNGRAADLLGSDRESLLGTPLWDSLSDDAVATLRPAVERAVETGRTNRCEWTGPDACYLAHLYPGDDGLSIVLMETTDRRRHEVTLGRLHEATRRMLLAETTEEVATLVSRSAVDILDFPLNAVHFYDEGAGALVPVTQSDGSQDILGDSPVLDTGLALEAFQSDTVGIYPDLRAEADVFDAATPFRSELIVPLTGYGVFIVAAETADAFTEADVTLAKLLGANATVALDQVTSESRLAQQRDNLELLTRMMSHDIRNDLQVVGAVAELLGEHVEGPHREYVEKILRNTSAAVELTTSAQELVEAMLRTEADPSPVALAPVLEEQLERLTETETVASVTVEGDVPAVSVVADEMLGSVFRNVLKNAVQHNTADTPEVTVAVETTADTVRVSVADNGRGVPDERKESIFGRGERGMSSEGTGIGLYLVQTLVDQYGGRVWVADNDPTGAVFVVELQRG